MYTIGLLFIVGCSLDDVENTAPITEENVITDEESARNVLNGVYANFRNHDFINLTNANLVSGIEQPTPFYQYRSFAQNQITPFNYYLGGIYTRLNFMVNTSNYLIDGLEAGKAVGISTMAKNEILGEAKTLRAYLRLMLLRAFGEFYDVNSKYGIVVQDKPIKSTFARNTVEETYTSIINDLKFAINNAPVQKQHFYMTQTVAKALLAKVYLYKKDYKNAEITAKQVIDSPADYALVDSYNSIFLERWDSPEVLFAPFVNRKANEGIAYDPLYGLQQMQSDYFIGISGGDSRIMFHYTAEGKYNADFDSDGNTLFFFRMAEVYLIHAEAAIRNNELKKGLASLNKVRERAGATKIDLGSKKKKELLKNVFDEKMLELFFETGETWYDLVRYLENGDLDYSIKQSLTKKEQLIFPIPIKALRGNDKLIQNPGYE